MRFIKISLCILLVVGCLPLKGDVGIAYVTDENKHSTKADFAHTFEYFVLPEGSSSSGSKCQATRIGRRWFATAAHCVTGCQNGCQIQMDFLLSYLQVLMIRAQRYEIKLLLTSLLLTKLLLLTF